MILKAIILSLAMLLGLSPGMAGGAPLQQEDPIEPRLKSIAVQLRCPVCQGETIYDSHSSVAAQMKMLIREQIAEGRSDTEIVSFFVERYGEFVLLEPHRRGAALFIWLFPGLALLAGSAAALLVLHRRKSLLVPASAAGADTDELIRRIERLEP